MWLTILTHVATLILGAFIGFTAAHVLLFILVLRDGPDDGGDKPAPKTPPPDGEEAARDRAWQALADAMMRTRSSEVGSDAFDAPNLN